MNPLFHTEFSISDSLKNVRKSVLIYETIISDNGWRAIGDTDTQEYIDNPENSMVIDFNTLANIEPAVLAVYDMPIGTDLEFCFDNTGRYFIDTNTGKRI